MSIIISPKEKKVKSFTAISSKLRLVFFGTPDFARVVLKRLLTIPEYEIAAVVTAPDKPKDRGQKISQSPVKELAQQNKIKVFQPESVREAGFISALKNLNADLFLTAAYGQILPAEILKMPRFGALNVHASLLPRHRGASPIQTALLEGDTQTGVSIILMNEKMDAGPVILQKEISIAPKETFQTLYNKLADLGARAAKEAIDIWTATKGISEALNLKIAKEQDETQATHTKIIKKEDGQINWQQPAIEIERQIRALNPWPGAFGQLNNKKFKFVEADLLKNNSSKNPGEFFLTSGNQPAVSCGQEALLIRKIQPEGKKTLSGEEFVNGYRNLLGLTFR